jgi:glycosyltransferase involved in cell wall biosynthesis
MFIFLEAADLLVLPMNKDLSYGVYSSPLKLFEYMASGTPILASDFGAIKEVLNEKNSFLFNPEDINDFIEKIKYISDNNEKAIKIGKESLKLVKEYTWEKRAAGILSFLK